MLQRTANSSGRRLAPMPPGLGVVVRLLVCTAPLAACAGAPPMAISGRPAFAQRTVVITGASSGFGRGIALALAARGANVVLAARRADVLAQVEDEARRAGGQALVVPTDVSDPEQVAHLAVAAEQRFGRIDVWINDAAVAATGRFDETPERDHARIVDTNLKGVLFGSHEAVQRFKRQGFGTLINFGSVESRLPLAYHTSYAATKAAILGFDTALNTELKLDGWRGRISVVTIMPWAVDTPFWTNEGNYTGHTTRMVLMDGPEKVVNAVLAAALHPRPEVAPGWKAKAALASWRLSPSLTEAVSGHVYHDQQFRRAPAGVAATSGNIHAPRSDRSPPAVDVSGHTRERIRAEDEAKAAPTASASASPQP